MAPWYIRARLRSLLRTRNAGYRFTARVTDRYAEKDRSRVDSVLRAIDGALTSAEAEYASLSQKVDDALTLTGIVFGETTKGRLVKVPQDIRTQQLSEAELLNDLQRLDDINAVIIQFKVLKAVLFKGLPTSQTID